MKTAEQLKGAIRNIAKDKNVRSQEVLQMFLFERILDRLAASSYKNNFILKGGLLISSMIGISERTTMDMDTTVRGIDMAEDKIERIVKEVLSIDAEDGIHFTYKRIEPIREDDDYNNFRVYMDAEYGKIKNPMKIDITTGDEITPAAVRYDYPLLFEERSIPVMAYTLETILAEKYELVGGNIKNCILNAAFLAAADPEAEGKVHMRHYLNAVKYEFVKVGKVYTKSDFEPYAEDVGLA